MRHSSRCWSIRSSHNKCLSHDLVGERHRRDAPEHRLARARFAAASDFAPERLILYSTPRESNLVFREVLMPAGVSPMRLTHIQLTEAIVEMVKADLGISVLPRWSVAPQIERRELVARPLTRGGKYRPWSAAYRGRGAPARLIAFVELLARHPLPLGTTSRERRRIAAALVEPCPPGADSAA